MSVQHTDVAAYSLGLLEQQDRQEFEAHLANCASCPAELAEFAAISDLLAGVDPVEPGKNEPDQVVVGDLMRRQANARRHRIRQQLVLAAAACLVLVAGGAAAGIAAAPHKNVPVPIVAVTGHRHSATDPGTGVAGTVGLVAKAWGTQVTLDLSGVHGPLHCELVAVSRSGKREVVTGWFVPASGYGVASHPGHLLVIGGTSIAANQISQLDVEVVHGGTLVSIPV